MTETAAARKAGDICEKIRLGRKARALLLPEDKPGEFLARLLENHQYVDAVRFMASALRARDAIWWACLCVRHTAPEVLPAVEAAALQAAVHYVLQPTEEHRRQAM